MQHLLCNSHHLILLRIEDCTVTSTHTLQHVNCVLRNCHMLNNVIIESKKYNQHTVPLDVDLRILLGQPLPQNIHVLGLHGQTVVTYETISEIIKHNPHFNDLIITDCKLSHTNRCDNLNGNG